MTVHVIVPVFNCYDGLIRCLSSLAVQTHDDMTVTIIDDASTDDRVIAALDDAARHWRWTVHHNTENLRCPWNLVRGIAAVDPDPADVVLLVDGDDWLAHPEAVGRVAAIHADPDVWLTYGSYRPFPDDPTCPIAGPFPPEVRAARSFRSAAMMFNHPIAFKAFLWYALPTPEMKDDRGRYIRTCYDQSIMYGMLEMAGDHTRFVDEVLYVYNSANPLSESVARRDESAGVGEMLRARPPLPLMVLADTDKPTLIPAPDPDEPS